MSKVADPLREFVQAYLSITPNDIQRLTIGEFEAKLLDFADEIDREHERRMEQCRHETKRAFAKYLRQITGEYERNHKRKSWTAQQRMQLELDVLKYKEAKHEDD